MNALDGIRVLDLSRLLPGGLCSLLMADLGAEVIKVEEPTDGDGLRAFPPFHSSDAAAHIAVNRGKRSVRLDLRRDAEREAFLRLAETADVVIDSFRPGKLERLGVGWPVLQQRNRRLVLCATSGFGQTGPLRDRAGHDLTYLALAGVLGLIGPSGGPPVAPGVQIADHQAAALAAAGILAALVQRERTGHGSFVDVSLTAAAHAMLGVEDAIRAVGGREPIRGATALSGALACYRIYRCSDGLFLAVAALEQNFWRGLLSALDLLELEPVHLDLSVQEEAIAALEAQFATRPRKAWLRLLEPLDVCVAPVLTTAEAAASDQLRGLHPAVKCTAGTVRGMGCPIRISDGPLSSPPLEVAGPPGLGEHDRELLGATTEHQNHPIRTATS